MNKKVMFMDPGRYFLRQHLWTVNKRGSKKVLTLLPKGSVVTIPWYNASVGNEKTRFYVSNKKNGKKKIDSDEEFTAKNSSLNKSIVGNKGIPCFFRWEEKLRTDLHANALNMPAMHKVLIPKDNGGVKINLIGSNGHALEIELGRDYLNDNVNPLGQECIIKKGSVIIVLGNYEKKLLCWLPQDSEYAMNGSSGYLFVFGDWNTIIPPFSSPTYYVDFDKTKKPTLTRIIGFRQQIGDNIFPKDTAILSIAF